MKFHNILFKLLVLIIIQIIKIIIKPNTMYNKQSFRKLIDLFIIVKYY